MTEVEWSEEGEEAPRKKGGVPKWVWIGCGGGCLLALLGGLALAIASVLWFQGATDPEKQWPRLQEILPFEERPTDLQLALGTPIPFVMDQFVLQDDEESYTATVINLKGTAASGFDDMFGEDSDAPFGLGAPVEPELGELEIQGQTVRVLRFRTVKGQGLVEELGPGIRVDLSRTGRALMVEFRRNKSKDPVTDEAVVQFFAHFDVWSDD